MAPKARIAFSDLLNSQTGVKGVNITYLLVQKLSIPGDLNINYYPDPYKAGTKSCSLEMAKTLGARIHSSSWGSNVNFYSTHAQEIDEFTWEHPDFLPLFAAGNTGEEGM